MNSRNPFHDNIGLSFRLLLNFSHNDVVGVPTRPLACSSMNWPSEERQDKLELPLAVRIVHCLPFSYICFCIFVLLFLYFIVPFFGCIFISQECAGPSRITPF